MTPILYAANEIQFNSMGIGALADTISAHVTEERNGAFELEFIYPVDGPLFGELQKDRIVKAKANDDANMDAQLFRIYYISKPINGQCQYKAEHVSYELGKNPITSVSVTGTAQQFMNSVLQSTIFPHRFTAISDDQTVSTSNLSRVSAREAFGGTTGSLIQIWGGELTFDNWLIRHSLNRGTDTGIIVGYGKNLTDLNQEEAIDTTYTSVYPYATVQVSTGEGEDATTTDQVIELPEKKVESQYVGNYAYGRCLPVDLSGDDVTDEASLRSKAQQYIVSNDIGKPTVNLTVSFINLWQTEEYKSIAPLEHINLCDYVTVRFKKLGVDVKAKVIKTDYDVLAERYLSVELGDPKSNLADDMNNMQSSVSTALNAAQQAIQYAGQAIQHADGTWTFYSETEPAGDIREGSIWFKIINGDTVEMYRYNGVSWDIQLSKDANDALNAANQAMESANGKAQVWHQAAQPTGDIHERDIWFRKNADGTITQFIYQSGAWGDPTLDGVKAAQDQADAAVATADAATAQATSAAQDAINAVNTSDSASTAAQAAQQTAGDAASQASTAWDNAQAAMADALNAINTANDASDTAQSAQADASTAIGQATSAAQDAQDALDGVSSLNGQVDTMQSDIAGKADATWVNGQLVTKADKATTYTKTDVDNALSGKVSTTTYNTDQSGIVQRFENNESSINQNADNIATKVSSTTYNADKDTLNQNIAYVNQKADGIRTDVNSLTQTVSDQGDTITSQGTSINQLSDSVAIKADKSSVDTLTGRISTAEATLTTQANQIAGKVSQTDYSADKDMLNQSISAVDIKADGIRTDVTGLSQTVGNQGSAISSQGSQINQLSGEISTKVSQTDFDDLSIGGRNWALGTSTANTVSRQNGGTNVNSSLYYVDFSQLAGKQVTISFDYQADATGGTFRIQQYSSPWIELSDFGIPLSDTNKHHYSRTRILSEDNAGSPTGIGVRTDNFQGHIVISNLKLEIGNKATDWSPAPEDKADQSDLNSLSGTVTTQGTAINQLSDSITLKADKTTVDTLSGKVDQQGTQISANTNAISLKASQSTVDTLSGRISTAEATLTTQANQIAARITEADADSRYATQTALTATSSSLTSQISSIREQEREKCIDPSFEHGLITYNGDIFFVQSNGIDDANTHSGRLALRGYGQGNTSWVANFPVYPGMKIKMSWWVRTSDDFTCDNTNTKIRTELNGNHWIDLRWTDGVKTDWTYREMVVTIPDNGWSEYNFRATVNVLVYSGFIKIDDVSIKDVTDIDELQTQYSSLSQTLEGFQTTVQNEYAQKSMVTQTASALQSSIDGKVGTDIYNSKVSQLSNDINARVVKNDVVHQINISTEGILIDGSKTHITGQTTIDNAVIQSAMIAALDAGKITTGYLDTNRIGAKSITVDKMDVVNLAAISANLGTVTAGEIHGLTYTAPGINTYGDPTTITIGMGQNAAPIRIASNDGRFLNKIDDSQISMVGSQFGDAYVSPGFVRVTGNYDQSFGGYGESTLAGNSLVFRDSGGATKSYINAIGDIFGAGNMIIGDIDCNDIFGQRIGGSSLELRSENPFIDFAISANDYDVRLSLVDENTLKVISGDFSVDGSLSASADLFVRNIYSNTWNITTSYAPNVVVTDDGWLRRSTSATKYKTDIMPMDMSDEFADNILKLEPKRWHDKAELARYAAGETDRIEWYHGLVAEDVEAAGLPEFVTYNNGEVEGLEYDRLWLPLIPVTKRHDDELKMLMDLHQQDILKIALLESRLSEAESKIALLEAA